MSNFTQSPYYPPGPGDQAPTGYQPNTQAPYFPGQQPNVGYPQGPPAAGYPSGYPNQSSYPPGPTSQPSQGYPLSQFPPSGPNQNQTGQPPSGYPPPTNDSFQTSAPYQPPVQQPGENDDDDGAPTAPPLDSMEKLPGYENISFLPAPLPPPIYDDSQQGLPPERQPLPSFVEMKSDEAREALMNHVDKHCCYGKGPARDMVIEGVKMTSAFHYKLETFTEKRETAWEFEPYDGRGMLDGPMNGQAPHAWAIPVPPSNPFNNGQTKLEVPHTAYSKVCHMCGGGGRVQCKGCQGRGKKQCFTCNGRGRSNINEDEQCISCKGSGYSNCFTCSGSGMVKCKTCKGKCQLKCYVQLTVTWTNHVDDHIFETTNLPPELIRTVSGELAFQEQMPRVWPLTQFPNKTINDASNTLVQKHARAFPMERILEQRHEVRVVPVSTVSYTWKDRRGDFIVYGLEEKVYFPDYPASCCCGCNIL